MNPDQVLHLRVEEERLERHGFVFHVAYLPEVDKFVCRASHPYWGIWESFIRPDRDDARAQALQWASIEEAIVNEHRPTLPAPKPREAAE